MSALIPAVPRAGAALPFPLPPTFPPGVNPETYEVNSVHALLKEAAYLTVFTVPDKSRPDKPVFSERGEMIGVEVNEELHRLDVHPAMPRVGEGLHVWNRVGEAIANVHIKWMPCPDDFEPAPGKTPPPTPIDPTRSQRFVMLEGVMAFHDRDESGFHAFGVGRTIPTMVNGKPQLGLGSVIEVLEGFGKLKGLHGNNVVNGYITPPYELTLSFMMRFVDPLRRLLAGPELSPLRRIPHPAPDTVVIALLGETDPAEPVTLNFAPDGRILGSNVSELLRLAHVSYDTRTHHGIRSSLAEGPVVGALHGTLHFNPLDSRPVFPIYTSNGKLSFFDPTGKSTGGIEANINEGRAFRTDLPGAPMPVFRLGGFGALGAGYGQFAGVTGMMSLNACVSVFPRTLSNMYVLRINDAEGRFRSSLWDAWM